MPSPPSWRCTRAMAPPPFRLSPPATMPVRDRGGAQATRGHCLKRRRRRAMPGRAPEGRSINPSGWGQPGFRSAGHRRVGSGVGRIAPIRLITLAPSGPGYGIDRAAAGGLRVPDGHSNGRYEQGRGRWPAGPAASPHLFNAMSPLHHRRPGMVGAALAHAEYAELILDLLHCMCAGAIRSSLRSIPWLVLRHQRHGHQPACRRRIPARAAIVCKVPGRRAAGRRRMAGRR